MSTRYTTTVCEHYHRRPDGAWKCAADAHKFGADAEVWVVHTNRTDKDGAKLAVDSWLIHKLKAGE